MYIIHNLFLKIIIDIAFYYWFYYNILYATVITPPPEQGQGRENTIKDL